MMTTRDRSNIDDGDPLEVASRATAAALVIAVAESLRQSATMYQCGVARLCCSRSSGEGRIRVRTRQRT